MEALTIGRLKMPVLVVQKSPVALPLTGATTLCGLVAWVRCSRYPGNGEGLLDTFTAQVIFVVAAEIDYAFWGDLQPV